MIETIQLRLQGHPDIPPADLRLVNGRCYGLFDAGDGAASALLAALAGAEAPASGSVRVGGFDTVTEPVSVGRCVGYCPSDAAFYDRMTVWELLTFVSETCGEGGARAARAIHKLLEELDLDDRRNTPIGRLSIDERRRVSLAQALVGDPETVLLDEPTRGLRSSDAAAFREDVRCLTERGKTVFLASSNAGELSALCDRFLFVDAEGVTAPMDREELATAAHTPALSAFLGLDTKHTSGATEAPNEHGEGDAE